MTESGRTLAGIDGCRGGWLVARATVSSVGHVLHAKLSLAETIDEAVRGVDLAAIDIPIGLPDAATPGGRACDIAARKRLGIRASSVFSAPVRGVLAATTYDQALAISRSSSIHNLGLSKQTWNLVPKIREVDDWITPTRQRRLRETHPELVFATLRLEASRSACDGDALPPKKTAEGRCLRTQLLTAAGVRAEPLAALADGAKTIPDIPLSAYHPDDAIDALACLVAAHRIDRGQNSTTAPDANDPPRDGRGLPIEIAW